MSAAIFMLAEQGISTMTDVNESQLNRWKPLCSLGNFVSREHRAGERAIPKLLDRLRHCAQYHKEDVSTSCAFKVKEP